MSGLLGRRHGGQSSRLRSLWVDGCRYENTAIKFWIGLLDELAEDWAPCSHVTLSAPTGGPLTEAHLYPQRWVDQGLERLRGMTVSAALAETVAEMEILGPPAPVEICARAGETVLLRQSLPEGSLDADTFPCVVVWLLRWASTPPDHWNVRAVSGAFRVEDPAASGGYAIRFELALEHLSEGLYRRSVTLAKPGEGWGRQPFVPETPRS